MKHHMIYSILGCLFILDPFSCSFSQSNVKRIWLIRHCDKPKKHSNPCCTDLGYERAEAWGDFFHRWTPPENKIGIYTSNYHEKKQCETPQYPMVGYQKPSQDCQKSQRMFYTAVSIDEEMRKKRPESPPELQMKYCIGEYRSMLDEIVDRNTEWEDVIIVWEHTEIIEIIRSLGISISKWKKRWRKEYSIVFLIEWDEPRRKYTLQYQCFDFQRNRLECSLDIQKWLGSFSLLDQTQNQPFENNDMIYLRNTNHRIDYNKSTLFFLLFTIVVVVVIILFYLRKRYMFYMEGWRPIL